MTIDAIITFNLVLNNIVIEEIRQVRTFVPGKLARSFFFKIALFGYVMLSMLERF